MRFQRPTRARKSDQEYRGRTVVLDVDIRRAEAISRIATLERITGQTYGADFPAWREWWQEEQGKGSPTASREEARSEPRQQP